MSSLPATSVWTRPVPVKWIDEWCERLAFIPATHLTVIEKPGSNTARLQVYPPDSASARRLLKHFGGTLRSMPAKEWLGPGSKRDPIRVGNRLILAIDFAEAVELQLQYPRRIVLILPAGLAFGTGDHATTSMILDALARLPHWEDRRMLDIGTGSGVLALAGRALGSRQVEAFDYDPIAIRTAAENEQLNFPQASIAWATRDLRDWKSRKTFNLITANLFLETLTHHAARIARALTPGGLLLTSGLLVSQHHEVVECLSEAGLQLLATRRRQKWLMHTWTRPGIAH